MANPSGVNGEGWIFAYRNLNSPFKVEVMRNLESYTFAFWFVDIVSSNSPISKEREENVNINVISAG